MIVVAPLASDPVTGWRWLAAWSSAFSWLGVLVVDRASLGRLPRASGLPLLSLRVSALLIQASSRCRATASRQLHHGPRGARA